MQRLCLYPLCFAWARRTGGLDARLGMSCCTDSSALPRRAPKPRPASLRPDPPPRRRHFEAPLFSRNLSTSRFMSCDWLDSSSLAAALSSAVAEFVCTTLEIWPIPVVI